MDTLVQTIREVLPVYGPWLVLLLAVLETSFVTGMVVPSGLATSLAVALSLEDELVLGYVLAAALAGGWLGDSLGFWIGHVAGGRAVAEGRLGRAAARHHPQVRRFIGRHPIYSVTLARLVSFARTFMPMAAGMSGLRYRRFIPYEAAGLIGWVAIYGAIGVLAGESWGAVAGAVGVGGALAFAAGGLALWVIWRRRAGGGRAFPDAEGTREERGSAGSC